MKFQFNEFLNLIKIINVVLIAVPITLLSNVTNKLTGNVSSISGEPIPSVRVYITDLKKQSYTNSQGTFLLKEIPDGKFKLSLSRIGYRHLDTLIEVNSKTTDLIVKLEESDIITDDVVITGTRSYKHIEDLAIPIQVISKSEINNQGYLRLNEVINQEMGIPMTEDKFRGMQVQGLDGDYTLILVNGEPVTGRTGGNLNIARFSIANLNRIEVVRGPSSSLYGSAALAGVVNLITEKPSKPLNLNLATRYGSHSTYDLAGDVSAATKDKTLGMNLFIDSYRSEGFSVLPGIIAKTVPDNQNLAVSSDIFYDFSRTGHARLGGKMNNEEIKNDFWSYILKDGKKVDSSMIDDKVTNDEYSIGLNLNHKLSNKYDLEERLYYTTFRTETMDKFKTTNALYEQYLFRQYTFKGEVQSTSLWGSNQVIGGFGVQVEGAESNRIADSSQLVRLIYGYLQDDWQINDKIDLIGSLRYDSHSAYKDNLSPKVAVSWKSLDGVTLRASVGSGFKAPSFEELYLNWSLASEGYTVLGIKNFQVDYAKLLSSGQISEVLINVGSVNDLRPEKSWAINFGGDFEVKDLLDFRINFFRNNVNDLIEFLPVALKTNGRLLYTYFNVSKIHTQGFESRVKFHPYTSLDIELNYQLLFTADDNVENILDDPNQVKYWKRDGDIDRRVNPDEYGGLLNRSRHNGAIRATWNVRDWDFFITLRGVFKSKYGFADVNGNTILDDPKEYAPGYAMWYLSLSKKLFGNFTLQAGIDNLADYKTHNTRLITSGRTGYVSLLFNYIID